MKPIATLRTAARPRQAGAASLIVVMVLFFLMSLVAAYTSRNLIFEQRTSVNQYRSTQAYEAAEAGLEWALAMLNSGRIGASCLETGATAADTSFRQRYLTIDTTTGRVAPLSAPTVGTNLWPSCVSDGAGGWTCSCPTDAAPTLTAPGGTGVFPAFRVRFTNYDLSAPGDANYRAGLIRIESNGCTRLENSCLDHPATGTGLEGHANVAAIVALTSALPTPPGATLTLLNGSTAASTMKVYNTNADLGGTTVQAGSAINTSGWTLRSVPGTPGQASLVPNDSALAALAATPDRAFASLFGMWPNTYRTQPAAVRLTCPVAGCRAALATAVTMNPDRVIWVNSPNGLNLESAGTIGTAANPAMIVVDGPFVASPGVRINGFVYTRSGDWQGDPDIRGGAFVEAALAATANTSNATVVMDNAALNLLRWRSGSFVRAPGGWDDFRDRGP